MKLPWMNPRLRELVALAVLAAFGCGLALSQGDLLFVAIFGAACAMTIIETIRRFP
jgi:alkylhydroperoxidase/carboxymuconolactone decarboxylase family protein YurZ